MSILTDLLSRQQFDTNANSGRAISAISGIVLIVLAMRDKRSNTISKWIKIGTGASLVLKAVSGANAVRNKRVQMSKAA